MAAPVTYNPGELAVIEVSLTDINGVPADPTTLTFRIQRQRRLRSYAAPAILTYTVPDGHITKTAVGEYTCITDAIAVAGSYDTQVLATGVIVKTLQGRFYVRKSNIE